ncbi:MAG: hypothetical protein AAGK21_15955 [Bacteroidota bacterium]
MRRPDYARLAALDRALARDRPVDVARNFRIVEALRQEAIALGAWPPEGPLAGVETDARVARVLNRLDVRGASR